ncbi:MAG: TrkA C-terminal domain-containing protein [Myxococcales bacterium]
MVEFSVPHGSELASRSLAELSLRDREVQVLSITRAGSVVPNPRGSDTLQPGDVLLCFGSYATLRALVPRGSSSV